MVKLFRFVLLLLIAPVVCAEEYYWTVSQPDPNAKYPSVKAACNAFFDYWSYLPPFGNDAKQIDYWPNYGVHMCQYYYKPTNDYRDFKEAAAKEHGDSCPQGKVLNEERSACVIEGLRTPEECLAESGNTAFELEKGNYADVCILGCYAKTALAICGNAACPMQPVNYTGDYCDGEDHDKPPSLGPPDAPENPDSPDSPKDPTNPANNCPEGHVWAKSGDTGVCVKKPNSGNENASGSGNGDSGGSGSGSGSGDGNNPGSGAGSGNGTGDGKGGGGDGGGNGNGKAECKPGETCEDGKSKVSGEACDTPLVCEGDAVQCAILKRQKEQACAWKPDAEKEAQLKGDIQGWVDEEKAAFEENTQEIPTSDLFNQALNKGRWLPTNCPVPKKVTVMGRTLQFEYQPLCKFAEWLAPLIVLLASLFFAITVAKAVKGS